MKKIIFISILMLFALTVSASADGVIVNGNELAFSEESGIPFVNSDDRTMVPVRLVAESLGADVSWSEPEQKVTVATDECTIEVFVGKTDLIVNGKKTQMDTSVTETGGRTYLPVRYIAEAAGCNVMWFDYKEKAVIMDKDYYARYITFRDMFEYEGVLSDYTEVLVVTAMSEGKILREEAEKLWSSLSENDKKLFVTLATMEKHSKNPQYPVSAAYVFKDVDGKQYYFASCSTFSYDVQLFDAFGMND